MKIPVKLTTLMSRMVALGAAVALSACAASAPPLVYSDPFQGLLNQSSTTVPKDAPVGIQAPVGLIFSNNVETWFQYAAKAQKYLESYGALTNTTAVADADPRFVASRVAVLIKAHYPTIEQVNDFNQAVATGKKTVCLIDFQVRPGSRSFQTTTVDVTAFFFDSGMQPVTQLSGHGEGVIPFPAWDAQLQPSTDAALQQLDQKLSAFAH